MSSQGGLRMYLCESASQAGFLSSLRRGGLPERKGGVGGRKPENHREKNRCDDSLAHM